MFVCAELQESQWEMAVQLLLELGGTNSETDESNI